MQVGEGAAEQPGHVHLGDPELGADLGLGLVAVEPQRQQPLLALGQLLKVDPDRLHVDRLVQEPIGFADDDRLHEWGFGITNLIPRPTPGIDTLRPEEYAAGAKTLRRKIRRVKPEVVAFVGVTLFRSVFGRRPGQPVALGAQDERIEGARVFVLPNPSGRNANFSYGEMLDAFVQLRRALEER